MQPSFTGSDTIARVLARRALDRAGAIFLVYESLEGQITRRSYAEIDDRARRSAGLLQELGVDPGDRFNLHMWNCPEFFELWFGAAVLGAVAVPTNPLLTTPELTYVLRHAQCRLSVTQRDLLETVEQAASGSDVRVLLESELDAEPARTPPDFEGRWDPLGVVSVLYTSGTTSRPKGVLVTNANYLYVGEVVAQHLRMTPDDRMMIALPLFHANAQYYSTMSALATGSTIVVAERFSASRWPGTVARHQATLASLFAAPIRMLLAQAPRDDERAGRLRAVIFSQNVTSEQLTEFETRFGCPLLQLYGMTETVAPPVLNPLYGERRNMTIGRPTLPSRVRIVNSEGGDAAVGEVGELWVRGEAGRTVMAGYLDDPEATAAVLHDGWLRTGDNVSADADGYLTFVDRAKDMIKRAGENVSAGEVENVVNSHPAVFESAAIGIPDEIRDEAIKVFVVLREGRVASQEEIIDFCAARLAKFKVPQIVELVDSLPRTSVGKIQKEVLRNREPGPQGGA